LPETESLTSQRSGQGSKTTEGRKGAPRARADLDGENDVIRWPTQQPTPPPHHQTWSCDKRSVDLDGVRLGWPGRCRPAGSPDLSSGPRATARAWNGHPGFRFSGKAPRARSISKVHCRTQPSAVVALPPYQFGCQQRSGCCPSQPAASRRQSVAMRSLAAGKNGGGSSRATRSIHLSGDWSRGTADRHRRERNRHNSPMLAGQFVVTR